MPGTRCRARSSDVRRSGPRRRSCRARSVAAAAARRGPGRGRHRRSPGRRRRRGSWCRPGPRTPVSRTWSVARLRASTPARRQRLGRGRAGGEQRGPGRAGYRNAVGDRGLGHREDEVRGRRVRPDPVEGPVVAALVDQRLQRVAHHRVADEPDRDPAVRTGGHVARHHRDRPVARPRRCPRRRSPPPRRRDAGERGHQPSGRASCPRPPSGGSIPGTAGSGVVLNLQLRGQGGQDRPRLRRRRTAAAGSPRPRCRSAGSAPTAGVPGPGQRHLERPGRARPLPLAAQRPGVPNTKFPTLYTTGMDPISSIGCTVCGPLPTTMSYPAAANSWAAARCCGVDRLVVVAPVHERDHPVGPGQPGPARRPDAPSPGS